MASGLFALFDDVAAIAKVAAASIDDVTAAAGKASAKAAGIVIDDTAVTPRYVTGFAADRELPIIWKIALGSLRNKLLFLLPGCLALSAFAPWALTPLLMIGGAYLCYEGAEKIIEVVMGHAAHGGSDDEEYDDPTHMEAAKVSGAIRTDFILSAEIMAIALADVATRSLVEQAAVLAVVGIFVTVGVYGLVGMIVKMDDVGLHMAKGSIGVGRAVGRGLVQGMPGLLKALGIIGTAAMLWVGGGIIVHGMEVLGFGAVAHAFHDVARLVGQSVPGIGGLVEWIVNAAASGLFGLVVGAMAVGVMHLIPQRKPEAN